jgi:hypothetical protein
MTCLLCKKDAVDSMTVETGNNAEMAVEVDLCREHFEEQEQIGYEFESKYYAKIEEAAWEKLRSAY